MKIKQYFKRVFFYIFKGVPIYNIRPQIVNLERNTLLEGRTALITGGASGIGFGIAKSFLNCGANVIITGRNKEKLEEAKCVLQEQYLAERIDSFVLDLQEVNTFSSIFDQIVNRIGERKLDILVNNAGVLGCQLSNAEERSFDTTLDTNIKGPFFLSKIVGEYMKNNNIYGNILNIASSSSFRPAACAYTISKWGLRGFTLGLAKSLIPYNIVVNGIAPGPTATSMVMNNINSSLYIENNPIHRYCTVEEISNMATILVSDMSRTIVGDIICMTGGAGLITYDDISYNF